MLTEKRGYVTFERCTWHFTFEFIQTNKTGWPCFEAHEVNQSEEKYACDRKAQPAASKSA
jgi:hypothetical protein